uniref:Gustatory receptor n=1 Tax=Anopheles minimus TaxID=112268 RepID=A0A182VW89_9DIPT
MVRRGRIVKFLLSHSDVYDVINLHLLALKMCGELFVVRKRNTNQLYISWKSFACFLAQLLCLLALVIGGHFAHQRFSEKDATYLHQGTSVLIRISGVFAIVISISNAIVGKRIWAILECFDRYDKRMILLNATVDHRTQKLAIMVWTVLFCAGVAIFVGGFIFAIVTNYSNPVLQLVTITQIIIFVMVIVSILCQMVIVMYMASFRFYHLRRFFEVNFLPWQPSSFVLNELPTVNEFRRLTDSALFTTVMELYHTLQEAMRLIHKAYSVQLLSMTVSNIPSPTLAMFATYRSFMTSNYDMQNLIVTMSLSSIMYLLSYYMLIFLSAEIKRESLQLIKSFHHFTNLYNAEFERIVKISADQMNDSSVALHLGPIELNWKLAFSMMSTMISYLVILIQFDRSSVGIASL